MARMALDGRGEIRGGRRGKGKEERGLRVEGRLGEEKLMRELQTAASVVGSSVTG
jgi:hypothetical protein